VQFPEIALYCLHLDEDGTVFELGHRLDVTTAEDQSRGSTSPIRSRFPVKISQGQCWVRQILRFPEMNTSAHHGRIRSRATERFADEGAASR